MNWEDERYIKKEALKNQLDEFDEYIANILLRLEKLDELYDIVRRSNMDKELQDSIMDIETKLIRELGVRVAMIFDKTESH